MNIIKNKVDIFSVELNTIKNITNELDENLFNRLAIELPEYVNKYNNYWLINTSLTVGNTANNLKVQILNVFLQYASNKSNLLQITNR